MMQVIRDSSRQTLKDCVIALGNFDGLHLGHQAVIAQARSHARECKQPLAVMTFEPHPRRVFRPDLPVQRILPMHEKLRLLAAMGVDFVRVLRFTRGFAQTSAQDFVAQYLQDAAHVVTGDDFTFGHNREGNSALLSKLGDQLGFGVTACAQLEVAGERCSSTRIREALAQGDMTLASALLGRPYSILGIVRQGDKRGRSIGFPTANLFVPPIFLPRLGVYAAEVKWQDTARQDIGCHSRAGGNLGQDSRLRGGDKSFSGQPTGNTAQSLIKGVANLGYRPTFSGTRVRLEVHLFNWQGDIYGERLEVELLRFIRPEQKFDGIEALQAQIAQDVKAARML